MQTKNQYGFEMINKDELDRILQEQRVFLIDLRDRESYEKRHLQGARNFSLEHIEKWKSQIPEGVTVILYCEHGNRSILAARKLRGRRGKIYTLLRGIRWE